MSAERSMLVVYDIPQEADMDNPSAEFRRFAFRINLSCWVMKEGDIPLASFTLNRIRELGGNWHALPFAEEGEDTIVGLAAHSIQREIAEHMERAGNSFSNILDTLHEADQTDEEAAATAVRTYRNRANQITRRLNLLLRDMRLLTRRWGLSSHQVGLLPAMSSVASLQTRMYQEAAKYVQAATALRNANHPLASAALAGQVPLGIMADAMDDADMRNEDGTPMSDGLRPEI